LSEDELIDGCVRDEPACQKQVFDRFAGVMLGVCNRYARNAADAEDILQDGFIKVFGKMHQFKKEGSFEGWMRRIMVHSSIEYYRKHHKMMQLVDLDEAANHSAVNPLATANLEAKELMLLIQQLSPGYRIVFNLYAIEGYSHKEIAGITGITEGASKSQLSRARGILKEKIIKMEGKRYGHAG